MIELKYRVWNIQTESYEDNAEVVGISPDGKHIYFKEPDTLDEIYSGTIENFIVELDTGLKDKNGAKIHDGDIVEEKINTGDYDVDGTYRYKVIWDNDMLCWSLDPNGTSIHKDLWECNQSLKVIGNIHENPELVGGEE